MRMCLDALSAAEMGFRLGPIVEAEHRLDAILQAVGQVNRASTSAIGALGMLIVLQLNTKGLVEVSDGAGERNAAARSAALNDS